MFGHFYNTSTRRYIILLGELLNGIQVVRNRNGQAVYQKVPITYASKERFMAKLDKLNSSTSDHDIAKVETILPRIHFHMADMEYNPVFKTSQHIREVRGNKETRASTRGNPVPVKYIFEVGIYTRYEDDMLQIVEQIVPYFQPNFCCRIQELHDSATPIDRDVQITIQSISPSEEVDGDSMTRRRLEWTIIFELDGWMYPPTDTLKGEIRTIYLDFFANQKMLPNVGNFESTDLEVAPRDAVPGGEYEIETGWSSDTSIPTSPEQPHVRK